MSSPRIKQRYLSFPLSTIPDVLFQQLGLVNRHGIITRVHYASPFKGSLQPGDVILQVNGTAVTFDDKTTVMGNVEDKTTSQHSKTKEPEKKPEK